MPHGASARKDGSTRYVETRRFEAEESEIGRARMFVRGVLSARDLSSMVTTFDLMVSELVTNAIVHGEGAVDVTVAVEGIDVRLYVHDSGAGQPTVRIDGEDVGGWGLSFVDRLADSWGAVVGEEGTSVWLVKRAQDA